MEHKYNQLSVERYSTNLAKLLCDRYFTSNQAINGQQLIAFSSVKQVNLFVIQELLLRWNQEMANLKSPYFDFEHEEVKEALVQFMNVLSRKILVKRPHFEPLLTKAIADTLRWVLDPAQVFDEKFLKVQDAVSGAKLLGHLKYLHLHKDYVRRFLEGLVQGVLPHGNVLNQFRTYLLRNPLDPQTRDQVLADFNDLLPLDKTELLQVAPSEENEPATPEPVVVPAPAAAPEPAPAPAPAAEVPPAVETVKAEPAPQPTPPPAEVPAPSETPMPTAPPPVTTVPPATKAGNDVNLNERFRVEKPTLNDRLAKPVSMSLVENQMGKKIESLKDSISINQRFGFINELFNGENMEYHKAIKTLDEFQDAESAKTYVTQDLGSRYNWSKKEEHVNKLLRLIDRKFS